MKPIIAATLALALSMPASVALAALILVEDDRFIEGDREGEVTRMEPPGALSWDWTAQLIPGPRGGPSAAQYATFSGTTLSASGDTALNVESANPQEAISTFDVTFRVDRPTFVTLSGQFLGDPWVFSTAGPLLFLERPVLIFSAPNESYVPFSFSTTLMPEFDYRLFIEAALYEASEAETGPDLTHSWAFTLEVPELPAIALLPLVLVAAGLSRRGTTRRPA